MAAVRKDVERAFGILKRRWLWLKYPCRLYYIDTISLLLKCSIILHNMIVEDERDESEYDRSYLFDENPEPMHTESNATSTQHQLKPSLQTSKKPKISMSITTYETILWSICGSSLRINCVVHVDFKSSIQKYISLLQVCTMPSQLRAII